MWRKWKCILIIALWSSPSFAEPILPESCPPPEVTDQIIHQAAEELKRQQPDYPIQGLDINPDAQRLLSRFIDVDFQSLQRDLPADRTQAFEWPSRWPASIDAIFQRYGLSEDLRLIGTTSLREEIVQTLGTGEELSLELLQARTESFLLFALNREKLQDDLILFVEKAMEEGIEREELESRVQEWMEKRKSQGFNSKDLNLSWQGIWTGFRRDYFDTYIKLPEENRNLNRIQAHPFGRLLDRNDLLELNSEMTLREILELQLFLEARSSAIPLRGEDYSEDENLNPLNLSSEDFQTARDKLEKEFLAAAERIIARRESRLRDFGFENLQEMERRTGLQIENSEGESVSRAFENKIRNWAATKIQASKESRLSYLLSRQPKIENLSELEFVKTFKDRNPQGFAELVTAGEKNMARGLAREIERVSFADFQAALEERGLSRDLITNAEFRQIQMEQSRIDSQARVNNFLNERVAAYQEVQSTWWINGSEDLERTAFEGGLVPAPVMEAENEGNRFARILSSHNRIPLDTDPDYLNWRAEAEGVPPLEPRTRMSEEQILQKAQALAEQFLRESEILGMDLKPDQIVTGFVESLKVAEFEAWYRLNSHITFDRFSSEAKSLGIQMSEASLRKLFGEVKFAELTEVLNTLEDAKVYLDHNLGHGPMDSKRLRGFIAREDRRDFFGRFIHADPSTTSVNAATSHLHAANRAVRREMERIQNEYLLSNSSESEIDPHYAALGWVNTPAWERVDEVHQDARYRASVRAWLQFEEERQAYLNALTERGLAQRIGENFMESGIDPLTEIYGNNFDLYGGRDWDEKLAGFGYVGAIPMTLAAGAVSLIPGVDVNWGAEQINRVRWHRLNSRGQSILGTDQEFADRNLFLSAWKIVPKGKLDIAYLATPILDIPRTSFHYHRQREMGMTDTEWFEYLESGNMAASDRAFSGLTLLGTQLLMWRMGRFGASGRVTSMAQLRQAAQFQAFNFGLGGLATAGTELIESRAGTFEEAAQALWTNRASIAENTFHAAADSSVYSAGLIGYSSAYVRLRTMRNRTSSNIQAAQVRAARDTSLVNIGDATREIDQPFEIFEAMAKGEEVSMGEFLGAISLTGATVLDAGDVYVLQGGRLLGRGLIQVPKQFRNIGASAAIGSALLMRSSDDPSNMSENQQAPRQVDSSTWEGLESWLNYLENNSQSPAVDD